MVKNKELSPEGTNEFGDENDDFIDEGRCVALSLAMHLKLEALDPVSLTTGPGRRSRRRGSGGRTGTGFSSGGDASARSSSSSTYR